MIIFRFFAILLGFLKICSSFLIAIVGYFYLIFLLSFFFTVFFGGYWKSFRDSLRFLFECNLHWDGSHLFSSRICFVYMTQCVSPVVSILISYVFLLSKMNCWFQMASFAQSTMLKSTVQLLLFISFYLLFFLWTYISSAYWYVGRCLWLNKQKKELYKQHVYWL